MNVTRLNVTRLNVAFVVASAVAIIVATAIAIQNLDALRLGRVRTVVNVNKLGMLVVGAAPGRVGKKGWRGRGFSCLR